MELAALKVRFSGRITSHHLRLSHALLSLAACVMMYQEEELHSRLKQAQDTSEAPIRFGFRCFVVTYGHQFGAM